MVKRDIEILEKFVTDKRKERFAEVLSNRTRYATVVLEDLFQPHNASAVLRSCDLFGVQDIHVIENQNEYTVNPEIAVGASKWLNTIKYNQQENNTLDAINKLKKQGYRIVATTPHTNDVELKDFDISKGKFALVFGSELPGITDIVRENADEFLKINMYGFTESFNISVSVALVLRELIEKLHKSDINWKLEED
ncbi:MAG: RNA methyltransferase [Bacteroidota bacterium]|nr:RNA methyltransferase [Bacteroidota bacterium]